MKRILLLFAIFLSLSAFSKAQSPVSDVVWYKDTTGDSPFKYQMMGMWFSNDGKTLVVPQGSQLFLVNPTDGSVMERKEMGINIRYFSVGNDKFILNGDTAFYVYNKNTYELIKKVNMPEQFLNLDRLDFYLGRKTMNNLEISPDGISVVGNISLEKSNTLKTTIIIFDIINDTLRMIQDKYYFWGHFSPDNRYYVAMELDGYSSIYNTRPLIYSADLSTVLYNSYKSFNYMQNVPSTISTYFSKNSELFYFENAGILYSINMNENYKTDSIVIKNNNIYQQINLNDSLSFIDYYSSTNSHGHKIIYNIKNNSQVYELSDEYNGLFSVAEPKSNYIMLYGPDYLYKLNIPYDKITKTEEEINIINNGFTLAPNPTYDYVNYNIYLAKEQDVTYRITNSEGIEIKSERLGLKSSGFLTGTIYLSELPAGAYFVTFISDKQTIAKEKITITR